MPNINKVILAGHLTRDPENKFTPHGTALANIGLAVSHKFKNKSGETQEETVFVEIELWGKQVEIAGEYLRKGDAVMFEGRLKMDSWDDKQTGQKRTKMKVVSEAMHMLGGKKDSKPQQKPVTKAAPEKEPFQYSPPDSHVPF